jgi:hypothetical protein
MPTDPKVTPPMSDDRFRIQPKSTFDIAREWLVVRGYEPQGQVFLAKAELLAEFADMLTGQLQFERGNYRKIAEDALMMQPPPPIIIESKTLLARAEAAEAENTALKARIVELEKALHEIVDTLSPDDFAHWTQMARAALAGKGGQ